MLPTSISGASDLPAILFLHGGGLSKHMWRPVIERLPDFYCLAPDLPGHGEIRLRGPFDLDDAAHQVAELIRQSIPGRRAHLVGLSLGGAVALNILRLEPDAAGRTLVTGTSAEIGKFLGRLSLASLWILRLSSPEKLARSSAKQWGIPEQYLPLFHDDILHSTSVSFNRMLIESLMRQQLPERLAQPLLALVGEKETAPAKAAARTLAKRYPEAAGYMVPGLGHVWALQDPDLFAAVVRAWVMDSPLPASLRPL